MTKDYESEADELDAELLALMNPESVDATSAETTQEEQEEQVQDSPADETETIESTATQVPESQYKEAVRAMNRAQEELAHKRKDEVARDQYIQQLQERIQALESNQQAKQQGGTDDLQDVLENYPEIVGPLLKKIADLETKLTNVSNDVGNVKNVADHYQQTESQRYVNEYWNAIRNAHADVDDIANSPDYADWYDSQPPTIKKALVSDNAADVVAGINLYKASRPQVFTPPAQSGNGRGNTKLQAAREAAAPNIQSTRSTKEHKQTFTNAQIAQMSNEEYTKYEDAIDAALARGEVY